MRVEPAAGAHGDGLVLVDLLVGDDADGVAADPGVAAENGAAEVVLVLVELAAIDDARDDFAHVVDVACAGCGVDEAVDVFGRVTSARRLRRRRRRRKRSVSGALGGWALAHFRDQRAHACQAQVVVGLFEVDGAGDFGVHGSAAEFFGAGFLTDGGLDERWAGEKEARAFGHENCVGHDGKIRAAGNAHTHDGGDLRNAERAHDGVVTEDAAEVVGVGEDVFLSGRKTPAESTR